MAISRLQQARQMRKGGGIMGSNAGSMLVAPTRDGSRPGYYGPDAGFGDADYKDASAAFDAGSGSGENNSQGVTYQDVINNNASIQAGINNAAREKAKQQAEAKKEKERIDKILAEHRGKTPAAYAYGPPIVNPYGIKFGPKTKKETTASKFRKLSLKNSIDKKLGLKSTMPSIFELNNLFNPSMIDSEYTYNSPITTDMNVNLQNYSDIGKYGLTGKNLTDVDRMNRAIDQGRSLGNITQKEYEDAFNSQVTLGGGGDGGGGRGQEYLPSIPIDDEDAEEEKKFDYRFGTGQKEGLDVTLGRYFNQGGRVPRNMGGIMNAVPRQGYFLGGIGKAIKGVVGGVADAAGKVLKSDLGKMAIAGAAFYYGGGGGNPFTAAGRSGFSAGNFLVKQTLLFKADKTLSLGKLALGSAALPYLMGDPKPNEDIGMTDRGGRLIDPITGEEGTPASMRANIENAKIEAGDDPVKLAALNQKYNNMLFTNLPYENYGLYANGGRIARAEGGLMNLGGMEKDYRAEGGFVPIGREEKADDVPARLSVNEFVFTADAVRNAGGGDIDKGAEVMENMMKNLENGGRVSEESQGNTGAEQMFSVSERIGEVI